MRALRRRAEHFGAADQIRAPDPPEPLVEFRGIQGVDPPPVAVEPLAGPILSVGAQAIRLQKSLILEWEELPTAAAVERGIDCFVRTFDTDEPAEMAGAMLAELHSRGRSA